jgi:hypothetical protein
MPIVGYTSSGDSLDSILYNDLYMNTTRALSLPSAIKTRSECSQITSPEQPYTYCQPKTVAYGIAITGNKDLNEETYPVQLDVHSWSEVTPLLSPPLLPLL